MRSNLPAGDLRQRITINATTSELDDSGQPIRTPSTFASSVPCCARGIAGGEVIQGRQMHAEATTLFVIRYLPGVTLQMQVTHAGQTLGVLRVYDPFGDQVQMWIEAKHVPG